METAELFENGRRQAVRLPKDFRFPGDRVYLKRMSTAVSLLPYGAAWQSLVDSLELFSEDFLETCSQPPAEQRDAASE